MADFRAYKPIDAAPGSTLEPLLKLLRELDANVPWLHGKRVAIESDGSSTTFDVEHGLGREYVGGWIMDKERVASQRYDIITGSVAKAAGVDTSTYVRVIKSAAGSAETTYVWVY